VFGVASLGPFLRAFVCVAGLVHEPPLADRGGAIEELTHRLHASEQLLAASQAELTQTKINLTHADTQIQKLALISHEVQETVSALQQELECSVKEMADMMTAMEKMARCVRCVWSLLLVLVILYCVPVGPLLRCRWMI